MAPLRPAGSGSLSSTSARLSRIVFEPVSTTSTPRQIRRRPRTGRVVDRGEPGRSTTVQLLGERMPEIEAPQARLDVSDPCPERTTHRGAEHGRHRVAVDENERVSAA